MKGFAILTLQILAGVMLIHDASAYRALFIGAVGSPSHKNFFMGIINELVQNGYEVTLVTPHPSKKALPNVREIEVKEGDVNQYNINRFEEPGIPSMATLLRFFSLCADTLENDEVQNLVKEKFDIMFMSMFFCECYVSLVHQLQVPYIMVHPVGLMSNVAEFVGNPQFPSFVSLPCFEGNHPLTFIQRTVNVLAEITFSVLVNNGVHRLLERGCRNRGLCHEDMPSYNELMHNASLILVNSVRELETPSRPYVPGVVHVGGIHCRPAEPLPQDLSEWIDGAGEHGFIFFSLGSTVKPSDLPEKNRQVLLKVFGSLKQRVLWKWDKESMPDMPPNVRLGKWLPQQDILGHPKLRLFVTHGGLLSTYESVYHGRPILGMPVFADQLSNMKEVERQGWGKVIQWDDLTEEDFLDKFNTIMIDEKMQEIAQFRSTLMRDQPTTPKSRVTYWTDYVIRYKGAKHLRSPIGEMSWYKLYNMDVYLMLMTVSVLMMWISFRILCAIIKCLRGKPKSKRD